MLKRFLIFSVILFFPCFSAQCENILDDYEEISLEKYYNDVNDVHMNIKKNEKFKTLSVKDFDNKPKNEFKNGNFKLTAKTNKKTDKYLLDGIENKQEATLSGKVFELSTGYYNSKTGENGVRSTSELYVTPKVKITDNISLEINNYIDAKGEYFGNEMGLKYKTRYLKNGSIGITGGAEIKKNSVMSEKLKFTTNFYLF